MVSTVDLIEKGKNGKKTIKNNNNRKKRIKKNKKERKERKEKIEKQNICKYSCSYYYRLVVLLDLYKMWGQGNATISK